MKRILFLIIACAFSLAIAAQGNSNKDKGKNKNNPSVSQPGNSGNDKSKGSGKEKGELDDHNRKIWEGTSDKSGGPKASKNQPAKVRESFQRDYPNATNVYWTKYRGDWTATFGNGIWRSTAIYHANGQRKDTRTPILRDKMPRIVLDSIFKRRPDTRLDEAIKIEVPNVIKDIFRIKNIIQGKPQYEYYNADGIVIKYDY